jgi:hypothetical protein
VNYKTTDNKLETGGLVVVGGCILVVVGVCYTTTKIFTDFKTDTI